MVEPISIAMISGAAGVGAVLGRLTKYNQDDKPHVDEDSSLMKQIPPADLEKDMKQHPQQETSTKLNFFSIEGVTEPDEIIAAAKNGNQAFINIKKMIPATDKLYKFLHKLQNCAELHDMELFQITKELLLLSKDSSPIQVKTLSKMANVEDDIDLDPIDLAAK